MNTRRCRQWELPCAPRTSRVTIRDWLRQEQFLQPGKAFEIAIEAHQPPAIGDRQGRQIGIGAEPGRQFIGYGRESVREAKKVVWPSRQEAMQMTGYVFAFVVVMALMLWLTDKTLEWLLYGVILGWR